MIGFFFFFFLILVLSRCVQSHSERCTESFMRENVMEEMKLMQSDEQTKRKMLDILKRFHSEEQEGMDDSMDDDDDDHEDGNFQLIMMISGKKNLLLLLLRIVSVENFEKCDNFSLL